MSVTSKNKVNMSSIAASFIFSESFLLLLSLKLETVTLGNLLSMVLYIDAKPKTLKSWRRFYESTFIWGLFTWYQGDFCSGASSLRFPLLRLYLFLWCHQKCHAGATHTGVGSLQLMHWSKLAPVWVTLAWHFLVASCKQIWS